MFRRLPGLPDSGEAVVLAPVVGVWSLSDPPRLLFNNHDLAFLCIGRDGVLWQTKRISWDGFRSICVESDVLHGEAWSPIDNGWSAFRVNLIDGTVEGERYPGPGWNRRPKASGGASDF